MSNAVCRTCLTNHTESNMQFLNEEFLQRIEEVSGIEMTLHATFPNRICDECTNMLDISTKFRKICRSSENRLLSLLQSDVKAEMLEEVEDFDTISLKSDHDNVDFFETLIEDAEKQELAEIDDFTNNETLHTNEVVIPDEEYESVSSYEHIASDSESILGLINETKNVKSKTNAAGTTTMKTTNSVRHTKKPPRDTNEIIMCEICGNTYKQRNLLNMHMRRHLEEKPFECEICTKAFACASELRRHIRTHTGEKPYVCKFCGRTFTDRSTNIRHERIHTNTRPYTCSTCGKSFTYSTVLKNHMLIHTGEKKFACAPCNKTFSRKHQLEQHFATITHQQTIRALDAICISADTPITIAAIEPE